MSVRFSVIIPHFNGERILANCLNSLFRSAGSFEIILVDNGSTDQSIPQTREKYPSVVIVQPGKNLGYAGGCTYGAGFASGDFLIFLNNDTETESEWLSQLDLVIQAYPEASVFQPKILSLQAFREGKKVFDYAGAAGGRMDFLGYPFAWGRVMGRVEEDFGLYDEPKPVFWASGTALVIQRQIAGQLGFFDGDYFAHMEEIDLCWRVIALGGGVMSAPGSVVYHLGGQTLALGNPKKLYLNHRNNWYLLFKNTPFWFFGFIFPFRMGLDILAWLVYTFQKGWQGFRIIPEAWWWLVKNAGLLGAKRKENSKVILGFRRFVLPRLSPLPVIIRAITGR